MDGLNDKPKVVFLFSELSYYFLSGLNSLNADDVSVSVVHWDVNPEAPFTFRFPEHIQFFGRSNYDDQELESLIGEIAPEVVFCAGWLDKGYLKIVKNLKGPKKVLTIDNQWRATMRQQLARLVAPFNFLRNFDAVWVPGEKQKQFALKLGFKKNQITTGFYSADLNYFNQIYTDYREAKSEKYPHFFLFLGRYIEEKGLDILIEAFEEFKRESDNDWRLLCVGTGKLRDNYKDSESIKHLGFVQPYDLASVIKDAGVFVLPSVFEPWGLVIHECAAAGLPIITTSEVGSASTFVNSENGIFIKPNSKKAIKEALHNFEKKSDAALLKMSEASHRNAQAIRPSMWAEKLFSFIDL